MKHDRHRALVVLTLCLLIAGFQGAAAQVIISEVDPTTGTIELHNTGAGAVDVSGYQLCNRPNYTPIANLAVVSGNTTIPADGFLVVVWDGVAAADAELGLYLDSQFGNAGSMLSYVTWGSAGHGRESVAVAAGLWTAGGFIAVPGAGQTIARSGGGADPVAAWSAGAPTLGNANAAVEAPGGQAPGVQGSVVATLSGSQVVPPANTPADGQVTATLDGNVLSLSGSYQNLTSAINVDVAGGAHIHLGAPGDNGPIEFSLQSSGGTQGSVSGVFTLTPDQVQAFQAGRYYVQLHTIDNPAGELRAQLIASAPGVQGSVVATLSGSQVVPPANTPADGQVTATLDGNVLSLSGSYQNLTSAINVDVAGGAHIHLGAPGDNGPIEFSLQSSGGTQGSVSGVFTLTPDQVQAFQAGRYYVQLHTIDNPPGELRAQLIASAAPSLPLSALLGVWQITSSHVVEFRPDGKYRVADEVSGLQGGAGFSEGTFELIGSRLEVRDAEALQCSVADLGLYEVQSVSDRLTLVLVEDRCLERAALWPAGSWQRLR